MDVCAKYTPDTSRTVPDNAAMHGLLRNTHKVLQSCDAQEAQTKCTQLFEKVIIVRRFKNVTHGSVRSGKVQLVSYLFFF